MHSISMDKILSKLPIHPISQPHHHHDRRLVRKPRHRYEHPLMFHLDMGTRHHHRHTGTLSQHSVYSNVLTEMLQLHNYHRARHCAAPLTISQRLNQIAQSYAEHLAATSTFEHSGNKLGDKPLGENLYMQWISRGPIKASAKAAVKSWYDEIALHNFEHPTFSTETGHFTQMVWKATKTMGVGVAFSPDRREVYIVTNYYPAGNITNAGYFEKNVLPPNC